MSCYRFNFFFRWSIELPQEKMKVSSRIHYLELAPLTCHVIHSKLQRDGEIEKCFFSVGQANSKGYILLVKLFRQKFLPAKIFVILAKHPESCQNFCEAAQHKTAACKMDRCVSYLRLIAWQVNSVYEIFTNFASSVAFFNWAVVYF